uniref:Uncharacterized protein n=2 Tax=Acrobeloides nanus TaxID=290746 RepID=A0A914C230_9BILA
MNILEIFDFCPRFNIIKKIPAKLDNGTCHNSSGILACSSATINALKGHKIHYVNLQDRSGKTVLIHAASKGQLKVVEELSSDPNIDVNIADTEGNTALHHAAATGHAQIVRALVEKFTKVNIDQINRLGQTPLMKAAIQGRTNCARILLKAGADPYRRDNGRAFCALEWAEFVGRTECAHMIAHFMLDPIKSSPRKLHHAAENFKQLACLAAFPIIGDEMPVMARPRLRSAPLPTVKITPSDGKFFSNHKKLDRPNSSLA